MDKLCNNQDGHQSVRIVKDFSGWAWSLCHACARDVERETRIELRRLAAEDNREIKLRQMRSASWR